MVGWKGCGKLRKKAAILEWSIWMEQNIKVFDGKTTPKKVILVRVERLAFEHNTYSQQVYKNHVPRSVSSANSWQASTSGVIKINSDASLVT